MDAPYFGGAGCAAELFYVDSDSASDRAGATLRLESILAAD
jgi:hypothetical protein